MRNIGVQFVQIDELVEIHVLADAGGCAFVAVRTYESHGALSCGRIGSAPADEFDQFSEDRKLQFELDGVEDAFEERFQNVQRRGFQRKEAEVHHDDDHVDDDQLLHRLSSVGLERVLENPGCLDNIYRR